MQNKILEPFLLTRQLQGFGLWKRGKREGQDISRSYSDLVHKQQGENKERENHQQRERATRNRERQEEQPNRQRGRKTNKNKEGDSNIAKIKRERYRDQQECKHKRWQDIM